MFVKVSTIKNDTYAPTIYLCNSIADAVKRYSMPDPKNCDLKYIEARVIQDCDMINYELYWDIRTHLNEPVVPCHRYIKPIELTVGEIEKKLNMAPGSLRIKKEG